MARWSAVTRGLWPLPVALLLVTVSLSAGAAPAGAAGPSPSLPEADKAAGGNADCDVTVVADTSATPRRGACAGFEVHPDETSYTLCYVAEEITICQIRSQPGYGSFLP